MGSHWSGQQDLVPFRGTGGKVHCLICALDYAYSAGHELTSTRDGEAMRRIAHHAEAASVYVITDHHDLSDPRFPTRTVVLESIKRVANHCQDGDWFVWFFAGHGINVPDSSNEEADGFDEAFVMPERSGKLSEAAVLVDDEFAKALDTFIPAGVRILCISDCCHSGTICDIDSYHWSHEVYQLSASKDRQEAQDTGRGGVLTRALRKTLLDLGFAAFGHGKQEFSLQLVFDGCKERVSKQTADQDVVIAWHGQDPRSVAWPLCFPVWKYMGRVPGELQDEEDASGS